MLEETVNVEDSMPRDFALIDGTVVQPDLMEDRMGVVEYAIHGSVLTSKVSIMAVVNDGVSKSKRYLIYQIDCAIVD